jgi:hypothetical protein
MEVIVDWKFLAAHRAAKCYHASADLELDFVIACLAIHTNLKQKTGDRRQEPVPRSQEKRSVTTITIHSWLLTPGS